MADRSYIIDIILRARADTARAFAEATGQMEAYDALLDEQKRKVEGNKAAQKDYADELERGGTTLRRYKSSLSDIGVEYTRNEQKARKVVQAQRDVEQAQNRVTRAQREGKGSTTEYALAMDNLLQKQRVLARATKNYEGISRQAASAKAQQFQTEAEYNARIGEQARLLEIAARAEEERSRRAAAATRQREQTLREYEQRVNQVAQAEKRLATARVPAGQVGQRGVFKEALELDTKTARAKLDELRASERGRAVDLHVRVPDRDIALARAKMDAVYSGRGGGGGGRGSGTVSLTGDEGEGFLSRLGDIKTQMANLDTSTAGFDQHIRNAFGFAAVTLIQPLVALIVGLVGSFGALASAAIAAGSAVGTVFLSGIAQGIPVIGLFAAAMQRLQGIMGYVTTVAGQVQQRFIAQYQAAQQTRMGINQIAIAQHEYSDALFAQQQAVINIGVAEHNRSDALFAQQQAIYNVRVAELGLRTARRDATRQLQDLIFQEEQAKLAAEASSLAVTDAQKNLQRAVATGGDVQQAQLQLSQAQVGHQTAVAQAQRAISDAAPGSVARQNIQATVTQANRGVTQARRAVVDANYALRAAQIGIIQAQRAVIDSEFQVAQARAAIILAQQAAAGYNLATAAQLAWLRSQMTRTEKSLAGNILSIYRMFQGVHGRLRPVTDAILGAFIPLTSQIIRVINDPRIFGAILSLGHQIGGAIRQIINTVFSGRSLSNFTSILNAAAANLRPFATTVSNIFRGLQAIIVAAIPYVHQFAGFIAGISGRFAKWAESVRGQNWLKRFFDVAFGSLEAFIKLGLSVVRLFAAIVGPGGGAQAGIRIIQMFTGHINRLADAINTKGSPAWRTLHALWAASIPALHAFGEIMGAILHGLVQIGTSTQGRRSLQGFADIVAKILIPAFVKFIEDMGKVTTAITTFLSHHPALQHLLVDLIATVATISVGGKAIGLIFGPLAKIFGILKAIGPLMSLIFAEPEIAIIVGIAGAIVAIAAATGNLKNLLHAVEAPFIAIWKLMKPLVQEFGQALGQLFGAFGVHISATRGLHDVVAGLLSVIGFLLKALVILNPLFRTIQISIIVLTGVIKIVADVIKSVIHVFRDVTREVGDIIHGRWNKLPGDFLRIGKDIVSGLWNGIKDIAGIFVKIFTTAWHDLLVFLGIDSPSKKAKSIGQSIVDGIWSVVSGLPTMFLHLGENIIKGLINGIKHLASGVGHLLGSLIPSPLRRLLGIDGGGKSGGGGFGSTVLHAGESAVKALFGLGQIGGPIPGYGGGDQHPYLLEGGEHIFTKEEVRAAGGHGPIYALRRALGGGRQGGPDGFQAGGQVGTRATSGWNLFDLGLQGQHGQTTQGVTGLLGSILANLLDFSKHAIDDWKVFWTAFNKLTGAQFAIQQNEWVNAFKYIRQQMSNFFDGVNQTASVQFRKLSNTFKNAYQSFDTDSFNAFWYILHAAGQALQAFGGNVPKVQLAQIPKFAAGGFIGQVGERGRDLVHALLGRGEAVLNWGHQRVVEPAMRAYYGYGLNRMFQRTRGEHAGGGGGYATGGYVYPFPSGTQVGRVDQGVDADPPAGAPIGPMGRAQIIGVIRDWYKGQPFIWWKLLDGLRKGSFGYVSEGIGRLARIGQIVAANQAVAISEPHGTGIEYGWATGSGQTLARVTGGYTEGQQTAAGKNMMAFLSGLARGKLVGGALLGGMAGGIGAMWNNIKELGVRGQGILAQTLRQAIHKVTGAANAFGQQQAGLGGGSPFTGTLSGPVPRQVAQFMRAAGFNRIAIAGMLGNAEQESSMEPNAPGGGLWQQISNFGGGTGGSLRHQMEVMLPQIIGLRAALNNAGSPAAAAALFMNRFERPAAWAANLPHRIAAAQQAYQQGYARGGIVGQAVPIVAHVGEWVLNKMQQSRLAYHMGTTVDGVKHLLGFDDRSRGHYQGGGEVLPTISRTGAFRTQNVVDLSQPGQIPTFELEEINIYNRATRRIVNRIERNRKRIGAGITTFLANFNQVGGDTGLFALAAQAIDYFVTQQSAVVQLASAGVRATNRLLRFGRAQTYLEAAQSDLQSTESEIAAYERLRGETVRSLNDTNRQIRALLRRSHGHLTGANLKTYQQLIGTRNQLITDIQSDTQKIAQGISDQFTKQQAVFQARIDQALRPSALAAGFAQMAQSVAQAFGRQGALGQADKALADATQDQVNNLQSLYREISAKAAQDPRWQKMADDVASQLQSAISALAQAQAQALADAISAQDTQTQLQQAFVSMQQTIFQALQQTASAFGSPSGQFAAIQQQVGLSQGNAAAIAGQIQQYQNLYAQAQAQGNQGAMNQLTQTLDQLNATMVQANLQTQQLITSYYQLSATLEQSFAQSSTGFSQAAATIFQTIGAITGSLNLPQLIQIAQAAGQSIAQAGQQALGNINQVLQGGMGQAFGAASGTANQWLSQAAAAFQQGPAGFAAWLGQNAAGLAQFQAGLPSDEQTLFNNLLQALVDNTTAQVDNTQQLQQLNATTNQQQFTSSAWTMFREAIFTGMGGLLPQYALTVPSMDAGGFLTGSGLLYGHKGETIVPASMSDATVGDRKVESHLHITSPTEVADPVYLSNRVAWTLNHDPNSR